MTSRDAGVDLSVITATWKRPEKLARTIEAVLAQEAGPLRIEHIVISDGPDPEAMRITARTPGVIYSECEHVGFWGAGAKDFGIALAQGEYVCFFDDDNRYDLHAVAALWRTAQGVDIGIVQCQHHDPDKKIVRVIPAAWAGVFVFGEVDTMCACVRREVAVQAKWADCQHKGTDFIWLRTLHNNGATIRFRPVVIGEHL